MYTCISVSESWLVWFVVFLMIASLIWFLVNCSCSVVTTRLRLATLDDSCVSDRSVLFNDDSAYNSEKSVILFSRRKYSIKKRIMHS